jgi:cellulose synthase/poly-beta-1,6-N-acetylglucosamine synthase-like glycosyltransferase
VLILFYILAIQQLLQGLYSVVQGLGWLRFVRRRLATHAGFYSPRVAVICPCKGADPGLESNLLALTHFDYPNYELFFVVAKNTDSSVKVIERVKSMSRRAIHLVVAGPPEDSGEKVSNLRKAVEGLTEAYDVFVFTDSDIAPSRGWLTKLVTPLHNARNGATTTYRWLIPVRRNGKSGLASAVGSVWNASVATMLGEHSRNFCWGGGTAIRRQTFQEIGAMAYWQGAVSDDLALTNALHHDGRLIEFVPECLAPTPYATTWGELLEFTNRQIILTRVYSPTMWTIAAVTNATYVLTALVSFIVILRQILAGGVWSDLLMLAFSIPLFAAIKGALRTVAIGDLLPEWKPQMREWAWIWTVLAPVIPFLFFVNFCASLATNQIRWRGIRYRLISINQTQVISR